MKKVLGVLLGLLVIVLDSVLAPSMLALMVGLVFVINGEILLSSLFVIASLLCMELSRSRSSQQLDLSTWAKNRVAGLIKREDFKEVQCIDSTGVTILFTHGACKVDRFGNIAWLD